MAKSLERYEQLLAQDPTSSVFVELAKALLEQDNAARALEVCAQGTTHHPHSVLGRVLWGKALLQLGRPAEAMDRFDEAIGLDRENPHAYNLISEVLLQRGLLRSALPILRKASVLQPNNGRVREWLEQAQQALASGQPQLTGFTGLGTDSAPQAPASEALDVPMEEEGRDEAPAPVEALAAAPRQDASPELLAEEALPLEEPEEVAEAAPGAPRPSGGGLFGDLPPPEQEAAPSQSAPRASAPSSPGGRRSLFDDLPALPEEAPDPAASPRTAASEQDAAALAAAYEKELREKLSGGGGLLARYGLRLALAGVLLVVLGVGVGAFMLSRAATGGQSLPETLERAERLVSEDSRKSLDEALAQLALARQMDADNPRAWALQAWAHALRFADHGASAQDRAQARQALAHPGVREGFPGLALATEALVAEGAELQSARRALMDSSLESSEVQGLAGSLLMEEKKTQQALARFQKALALSPRQARTLLALGRYYQDFNDAPNALQVYARAREASPEHPEVRIALAELRLEQEQELAEALADVEPLADDAQLPPALRERQQLAHGQLLSALGRHEEARGLLARGTKGSRAFDFQLALGAAGRAAGLMADAQRAYEEALRLQPKSEEALEGLGRTLLARDREREVLSRLGEGSGRKVALVRAAAYVRLGDWRRARVELGRTRVEGRYPAEAIIYLALADAAEGKTDQAREVLEKALAATKGARSQVRVALGQVHLRERALDKAQALFEEAMADPRDYEGACALGRLLISRGMPDMALEPLRKAVARNGSHAEARETLGRTLLALGKAEEAAAQYQSWQQQEADSAAAQRGLALALLQAGRAKEGLPAAERAVKLEGDSVEAHRTHAALLFATGDTKGGFAALERANRLDPKDAETFCEIAHAFLRQGIAANAAAAFAAARREGSQVVCGRIGEHFVKPEAAERSALLALQGLADKAPTAWEKSFAHAARARVLLALGDAQGARAAADEAVRLAPHSGRGQWVLGLVAARQRQQAQARQALIKAVALEAAHGPARLALADLLADSPEDLKQAVDEYQAFLRLAGDAPEASRVKKALPALLKRAGR